LDLGLQKSVKGSSIYAVVKGVIDAGMKINVSKEVLPSEERISGKHIMDYSKKLKEAEIVVVATGAARKFSFNDFSPNSVIIDASTVAEEGALWGDVSLVGWPGNIRLAPTPGGVGPVTVAMLYRNFYSLK